MKGAGLEMVHLNANEQPWHPVYLFAVDTKKPEAWQGQFPPPIIGDLAGTSTTTRAVFRRLADLCVSEGRMN